MKSRPCSGTRLLDVVGGTWPGWLRGWTLQRKVQEIQRFRTLQCCSCVAGQPVEASGKAAQSVGFEGWGGSVGFFLFVFLLFYFVLLLCFSFLFVQFNTNYKCAVKNGRTSMKREIKTEMFENKDAHRCFVTVLPRNDYFKLQFENTSFHFFSIVFFLPIVLHSGWWVVEGSRGGGVYPSCLEVEAGSHPTQPTSFTPDKILRIPEILSPVFIPLLLFSVSLFQFLQ